jgi:hypothetical protein
MSLSGAGAAPRPQTEITRTFDRAKTEVPEARAAVEARKEALVERAAAVLAPLIPAGTPSNYDEHTSWDHEGRGGRRLVNGRMERWVTMTVDLPPGFYEQFPELKPMDNPEVTTPARGWGVPDVVLRPARYAMPDDLACRLGRALQRRLEGSAVKDVDGGDLKLSVRLTSTESLEPRKLERSRRPR